MSKPFIISLITFIIIGGVAAVAVFLAKGYRLSTQNKMIFGTGILSITSTPDQASVYLDGHLTTATNANVNSLEPKIYDVKIVKEGFIPWQKKVEVHQGLVSDIKAALYPAIPSVYPLTFDGISNVTASLDNLRFSYVIPSEGGENPLIKRSGLWVWDMSTQTVQFARGKEPHQILTGLSSEDLLAGRVRWSPDSTQLIFTIGDRNLLLETNKLNDAPKDITPVLKATLQTWDQETSVSNLARIQTIKDPNVRNIASSAAYLKWSPDDTKLLYSQNGKDNFKVTDLTEHKSYDMDLMPQDNQLTVNWLADSRHLVLAENSPKAKTVIKEGCEDKGSLAKTETCRIYDGTISVMEFDGANKSVIYAGQFDPASVLPWADGNRVIMISSIPTPTASLPNLFGINLK